MRRVVLLALVAVWVIATSAPAFHEGGGDFCAGCHGGTDQNHLRGSDPSSTCLRCHGGTSLPVAVLTADGASRAAGGDFYWLSRTYSWGPDGRAGQSLGRTHGHNIVAIDYGMAADPERSISPGGRYPSSSLGCTSCHDPHAQSVSGRPYRLLGGVGYRDRAAPAFVNPAPVAVAPQLSWEESDTLHSAYGSGMSEWCANCHWPRPEESTQHPSGAEAKIGATMADAYNKYVASGNRRGEAETAYSAIVPFETGAVDPGELDPGSTRGPEPATANVMCLTCHRAHASAFPNAGRWDFRPRLLADSHPREGDYGADENDWRNSYAGRNIVEEFGPYQRQLCNKCHAGD